MHHHCLTVGGVHGDGIVVGDIMEGQNACHTLGIIPDWIGKITQVTLMIQCCTEPKWVCSQDVHHPVRCGWTQCWSWSNYRGVTKIVGGHCYVEE